MTSSVSARTGGEGRERGKRMEGGEGIENNRCGISENEHTRGSRDRPADRIRRSVLYLCSNASTVH